MSNPETMTDAALEVAVRIVFAASVRVAGRLAHRVLCPFKDLVDEDQDCYICLCEA